MQEENKEIKMVSDIQYFINETYSDTVPMTSELADKIEKDHYLNDTFEVEIPTKKSKSEKPETTGEKVK